MEIHVHNGVIRRDLLEAEEIAVYKKLDGFYVRFAKKDDNIIIGILSPIIRPTELNIYKDMIKRYKISDSLCKNEILYGVVYGKGVKKIYDAPNNPIISFYNITVGDKYLSLDSFEDLCLERSIPSLSILYSGLPDKKYEGNYLVRYTSEKDILSYNDLYKRLHWHNQ